jgi:hypothetical protein
MGRIQTATFDRYSEESPRHLLIALYDPWVNPFVVPPQIFPTAADFGSRVDRVLLSFGGRCHAPPSPLNNSEVSTTKQRYF